MTVPVGLIRDHVAAAERMQRELLLICPDPNQEGFEHLRDEYRANIAARSMLAEAMDIIEISVHARQLQQQNEAADLAAGKKVNSAAIGISAGLRVGEEVAAKRLISRYVRSYYGE